MFPVECVFAVSNCLSIEEMTFELSFEGNAPEEEVSRENFKSILTATQQELTVLGLGRLVDEFPSIVSTE